MKNKNKALRLASCLLIAVLLTTCAVSGTFAKYVTSANGSDSARVAKWGFEAKDNSIALTDLFKNAYDTTVQAKADAIAPGTTGNASFTFVYDTDSNGISAPEVAYTFVVSTDGSSIDESIKSNTNIQWKLDNGAWGTWDEMINAIEALDGNKADNKYDPKTLPEAFYGTGAALNGEASHTVSWQWVFTKDNAGDTADTLMGNADTLAKVTIKITITATQVD